MDKGNISLGRLVFAMVGVVRFLLIQGGAIVRNSFAFVLCLFCTCYSYGRSPY